jgi:uncharacterized membrane protein YfcA
LPSDVLAWQAVALTILSYAVGILGGFVGLALGTIRLPAMLLLGMPVITAGGTNILVSTLSAIAGSIRHIREGRVDRGLLLWMGIPSAAGAAIGGFGSGLANEGLLLSLVGGFVLWQGVEFARLARREPRAPTRGRVGPRQRVLEALIGLAIGTLSGAVGLILGSIRLPALVRVLGVDPRIAAGTNLSIGMLTGIAGWVGHAAIGAVDYPLLGLLAASGVAGQLHGARLTGRASVSALLYTMAGVLLLVGALLLRDGLLRLG